jgi:cellulose synthase/poly-beta-1,6-N-acetylglucosamine synthase-like glycosyltransferase
MIGSALALPYLVRLLVVSKILRFILLIPSSYFAYFIGIILLLFFLRIFFYYLVSLKYWLRKEKITFEQIEELSNKTHKKIPRFTIYIPAREEADVIDKTIYRLTKINYPYNYYDVVIITDEKERRKKEKNKLITQEVVLNTIEKLKKEIPDFKVIMLEVPYDFDGQINGQCIGYEVPSTKGRALNYALSKIPLETDFCAFFDAEAGPNPDSFLAVAKNYLLKNNLVYQLPVFQVRNFWHLTLFCKIAALSQCFSHQYALPFIFWFMPFLGGTNMFIHKSLLENQEGFDNKILTEDVELGVRLYVHFNQWGVYLPYPSTEQTPATLKAYFRQRHRWGYGLMQTIYKLIQQYKEIDKKAEPDKARKILKMINSLMIHGPIDWIIYYPLVISATIIFATRLFKTIFASILMYRYSSLGLIPWHPVNDFMSLLVMLIPIPTLILILIFLKKYWHYINFSNITPKEIRKQLLQLAAYIFFVAPFLASFYVYPYVKALIDFLKNPHYKAVWIKTQRTKE